VNADWVLKDAVRVELPLPTRKTTDLEGRMVKDGVKGEHQKIGA
jgi:hypothetical protein